MNTREITLEEMLDQRELRQELIQKTLKKYPDYSIVSYKLNVPGSIKNNRDLKYAFEEGLKLLKDFKLVYDLRDNVTGPEALLISDKDARVIKKQMIEIEDSFDLGRLYDLDVVGVSRRDLNQSARKCLICEDEAHNCSRSRKHGLEEVLEVIYQMIDKYRD